MAVCVYSGGKWNTLAGKKISQNGNWCQLGDFDKMKIGENWHKLGFAETDIVGIPPVMQFKNSEEPATGVKWYVTPNGSGDLSGSSWSNAASVDTLRRVVFNAVSGDVIYFSEGVYEITESLSNPEGVNFYGGFSADNPTWEKRNGFLHQTTLKWEKFQKTILLDGFFLLDHEDISLSLQNCVVLRCDYIDVEKMINNCLFRDCQLGGYAQIDSFEYQINVKNSYFSGCSLSNFAVLRDYSTTGYNFFSFFENCQFYNCNFSQILNIESGLRKKETASSLFVKCNFKEFSDKYAGRVGYTPNINLIVVDCYFGGGKEYKLTKSAIYNSHFDNGLNADTCLIVNSRVFPDSISNSTFVNSYGHDNLTYARNSLSWNCNFTFNGETSASSDYSSEGIVLGSDNILSMFTNTGFYPARGVQNLGGCPCPFDDPEGFEAYVKSFGDWHPQTGSVLIGAGAEPQADQTDLDGVTRPSPMTIGCYEYIVETT